MPHDYLKSFFYIVVDSLFSSPSHLIYAFNLHLVSYMNSKNSLFLSGCHFYIIYVTQGIPAS